MNLGYEVGVFGFWGYVRWGNGVLNVSVMGFWSFYSRFLWGFVFRRFER